MARSQKGLAGAGEWLEGQRFSGSASKEQVTEWVQGIDMKWWKSLIHTEGKDRMPVCDFYLWKQEVRCFWMGAYMKSNGMDCNYIDAVKMVDNFLPSFGMAE